MEVNTNISHEEDEDGERVATEAMQQQQPSDSGCSHAHGDDHEEDKHGHLLLLAASQGNLPKVQELLSSGADPCCSDPLGRTPLILAAREDHSSVVQCLLDAGAPWNALDASGKSAGDYAMEAAHQSTFDLLLNTGVQAELIFGVLEGQKANRNSTTGSYLEERVIYLEDKLLDEQMKGVMMAWERPLMEAHAKAICSAGGNILNVGFGMGIIDTAIQRYNPESHTIIEAHPDVHAQMLATGWAEKPNVQIVFGRWQDVLPQLGKYDGIFFDTYGEYYEDMKEFHACLPKLLKPGGIYSYFNGFCADNPFFHVVYCQLISLVLSQMGISTQFITLPLKDCLDKKVWEGISHKYWQLDTYYLPICQSLEDELNEGSIGEHFSDKSDFKSVV